MSITKISGPRARLILALAIFLLAFGVRVLSWHDTRLEVGKIQTVVTRDYQRVAQLLRDGGVSSFFSSASPLADPNNLGHPPGYSILWASLRTSETGIQFFQITCDALSAVLIFLIVAELLTMGAGVIAGLLAALSPQFAWNAVLLLPDSLSVLPVLAAVYLIARAVKHPRLLSFLAAGALIGISCWLRANAMLLTLFVALAVPLLVRKDWRRLALAVVCGTLLTILPLTIRNAIVFHRFIPLSLGAGQTLLEGIGDYDKDGRLGVPQTDMGIMKQEAEMYGRPDYYSTLFNPDGVERERARLRRGFTVIRTHPFWFAGVMAKRASSMVRLERARLISPEPSVSHGPASISNAGPVYHPPELARDRLPASGNANLQIDFDNEALAIVGDNSRYGVQGAWSLDTKPGTDYLLAGAARLEQGRIRLSVLKHNQVVTSTVVDMLEATKPEDQPFTPFQLAFVADGQIQLAINNEAPNSVSKLKAVKLYELGPARFLWTRYPRFVIHAIQRLFLTAVILPLALIGLLILIVQKEKRALVILSMVPLYFFLVQSIVHTEYRYVLAVYYFEFAFVGVGIWTMLALVTSALRSRVTRSPPTAGVDGSSTA